MVSVFMIMLNRSIDYFLRRDFLRHKETVQLSKTYMQKMENERAHKQKIVAYLFHEGSFCRPNLIFVILFYFIFLLVSTSSCRAGIILSDIFEHFLLQCEIQSITLC
jgi:hypothetical protein